MVVLPWFPLRDFTMELALSRRLYVIRARHNHLEQRYALDVFTSTQEPLLLGASLVRGVDLLRYMPRDSHPGGHLYTVGMEPTYDNLLSGAALVVYDAAV